VNALRGHLAEFGFFSGALPHGALLERTVAAKGIGKLPDLIKIVSEAPAEALPEMARAALSGFLDTIALIGTQLDGIELRLRSWHKANAQSKRLETAPGIGLIGATALCALVPDPKLFRNGRHFAAWIGLTPRIDGTGGKTRLGRITKAGDRYLRRLFVLGATSLLRSLENKATPLALWMQALLARRSRRAVTVALANKLARIAWAIMAKDQAYKPLAAAQLPMPAVRP
jgi:transposase